MTWVQFASGVVLVGAAVALYLLGPDTAREVAGGLAGGGITVLGGGLAKRGPK